MSKQKDKKKKKGSVDEQAAASVPSHAQDSDAPSDKPKMSAKEFEKEMEKLQVELVKMQGWVKASGAKICFVFEGRDTAGKVGVRICS